MKNFNYIFSAIGWLGLIITLVVVIALKKCDNKQQPTIEKQTIINNYYDTMPRSVKVTSYLPGEIIKVPIPAIIDTHKILELYFAKYSYKRVFENDTIQATLFDTISKNEFINKGYFSYKWKLPIKTIESTTVTITNEPKKRMQFLIGGYAQQSNFLITSYGPECYLQTKKGNLFGLNYDIKNEAIGFKSAININEVFRTKTK